jgi:flagellar basal body-associated protein FliL
MGSGGQLLFRLSYVFKADGQDFHGTDTVSFQPGSKNITILYNPDNPNQNKIKTIEIEKYVGWFLLGLGIVFIMFFSGIETHAQSSGTEPDKGFQVSSSSQLERKKEEVQKDMRTFAEKNPVRGNLYDINPGRSMEKHAEQKLVDRRSPKIVVHSQAGTIDKKSGYCKNHPGVKANWRCTECGREFCEECVTPYRVYTANIDRSAPCSECKGRCIDLLEIQNREKERDDEIKAQRKTVRKLLTLAGAGALLSTVFLLFAPDFLLIPVVLTLGAFGFALSFQRDLDHLFGGDSIFSFVNRYGDTDSLIPRKRLIIIILVVVAILALSIQYYQFEKYNEGFFRFWLSRHRRFY